MEINAEQLLVNAMKDGIREGIKSKLTQSYSNPFDKVIQDALLKYGDEIKMLLAESLKSCLDDSEFRKDMCDQVRKVLGKTLVAKFGGELEKQVNQLKSDPATRARITLAIEEIVRQKVA